MIRRLALALAASFVLHAAILSSPALADQIVARATPDSVADLPAIASATPIGSIPQPLVIQPGVYSYNGISYSFTSPGLHFLFAITPGYSDGGHRIVWTGDIQSFMEASSRLMRYGRTDEGLSTSDLTQAMRERTVALRCGYVVPWLMAQAQALGFQARTVRMLTMEAPNNADDGHIAVEAMIGGQWVLFDVPNDRRFTVTATGQPASLKDVADLGYAGLTPIVMAPTESAPTPWSGTAFATEAYFNLRMRHGLPAWLQRIYQGVGIDRLDPDGVTRTYWRLPAGAESRKAWVEGLSTVWKVIPDAEWNAAFYP